MCSLKLPDLNVSQYLEATAEPSEFISAAISILEHSLWIPKRFLIVVSKEVTKVISKGKG